MKRIVLLIFTLCLSLILPAQVVSKTVNCTPGNLKNMLTTDELNTITDLTLTGTIDASDIRIMRDDMLVLSVIDMGAVDIAEYTGTEGTAGATSMTYGVNEMPDNAFCDPTDYLAKVTLTSVILPSVITSINYAAFYDCNNLTGSLTIPSSVTTIGSYAFYGCSGFKGSLTIPSSVTTINQLAFYGCSGLTGPLNIPTSVTSIGENAFYYCSGLTGSLTIPSSATSIKNSVFEGCSGLTGSLTIPSSITSIGSSAFKDCVGFTGSLTIPLSVTTIGSAAFNGCSGLTSIYTESTTPINLTSSLDVFKNINKTTCTLFVPPGSTAAYKLANQWGNFTNIIEYINVSTPGALSSLYTTSVFGSITKLSLSGTIDARDCKTIRDDMTALSGIDMSAVNIVAYTGTQGTAGTTSTVYNANEIPVNAFCNPATYVGKLSLTSVIMPSSTTTIGDAAFYGCNGLTGALSIPSTVTSLGNYAFYGCNGFTGSLTIPSQVKSIGNSAFYGCNNFKGLLTIPTSVTSIGSSAFNDCSGLTGSLAIPSSVTSIGDYAFYGCSGFKGAIVISSAVTSIGDYVFYNCSGLTGALTIPPAVTSIGNSSFYGCSGLTGTLTIPSSVASIGNSSFYGCSGLTGSLTIPAAVSSIGDYVFYNCSGLTGSLAIPSAVSSIGSSTFYGCSGFTGSLTIPSLVTSIGTSTFYGCSGFTDSLTISPSVTSIGKNAFYNCSSLPTIKVSSATPINLTSSLDVFKGINKTTCILYIPTGSLVAYKAAVQWKDFINMVEYGATALDNLDETLLEVKLQNGQLTVSNILTGSKLTVYNIHGSVVYSQITTGDDISVSLPCRGTYVVTVGKQNKKVVNL